MSLRKTDPGLHALGRTPVQATVPFPWIGRYQIVSRVAVGGMAEVFLARHGELEGFKTLVIIKKVLPHLAENPEFISMFLDEARIASLLDHPNIVRIFEVGRAGSEYFLAMDLVQGKPCASLIRRAIDQRKPLDHRIAALIVSQAAHGLDHAHALCGPDGRRLGLVHRDVSPQNILISFEGAVKVIDFGIARALGRLSDTGTGELKGKIAYMAPEQATGHAVDLRTDIFALGVVLWEAICGRRLYGRDTDYATMQAIVNEAPPRPSTMVDTNPALESIVLRALSHHPAGRFQSARDMAQALERYLVQAGGATTADLGIIMKRDFGEDHRKWRNTTRVALETQDELGADDPTKISDPRIQIPVTQPRIWRAAQTLIPVLSWSAKRWIIATGLAAAVGLAIVVLFLLFPRRAPTAGKNAAAPAAATAPPAAATAPPAQSAAPRAAAVPPAQLLYGDAVAGGDAPKLAGKRRKSKTPAMPKEDTAAPQAGKPPGAGVPAPKLRPQAPKRPSPSSGPRPNPFF